MLIAGEGEKGDVPGTFDCPGELALMLGTETGLAPRPDLAPAKDIAAQTFRLFVIDYCFFVHTERTKTRAGSPSSRSELFGHWNLLVCSISLEDVYSTPRLLTVVNLLA